MKALVLIMIVSALFRESFEDWIELSPAAYVGEYLFIELSDRKIVHAESITLFVNEDKMRGTARINGRLAEVNCILNNNKFVLSADGIHSRLEGKFVLKYPPANAKGPVQKGMLINHRFFARVEE